MRTRPRADCFATMTLRTGDVNADGVVNNHRSFKPHLPLAHRARMARPVKANKPSTQVAITTLGPKAAVLEAHDTSERLFLSNSRPHKSALVFYKSARLFQKSLSSIIVEASRSFFPCAHILIAEFQDGSGLRVAFSPCRSHSAVPKASRPLWATRNPLSR